MLSFHVKFVQTDGRTDGRTMVKQYAHDQYAPIRGHKNAVLRPSSAVLYLGTTLIIFVAV